MRIVGQSVSEHAYCNILRDVVDRKTEYRLSDFSLGSRVIQTLGGGCSCRDKLPIVM